MTKENKSSLVELLRKLPSKEDIQRLQWEPAREFTYIQGIEKGYEKLRQEGTEISKELKDARYNTMEYLLEKLYLELDSSFTLSIKERNIGEEYDDFSPATFRFVANQLADYFEKFATSAGWKIEEDGNYLLPDEEIGERQEDKRTLKMLGNLESLAIDGLFDHDEIGKTKEDYIHILQDVEKGYESLQRKGINVSKNLEYVRHHILIHSKFAIQSQMYELCEGELGDYIVDSCIGRGSDEKFNFNPEIFIKFTKLIGEYFRKTIDANAKKDKS